MNLIKSILLTTLFIVLLPSCLDHDNPQLDPIDTTQVKITASVSDTPNASWLNVTEELTISVSNVEMNAPKGVVLRSISLITTDGSSKRLIDEKPYSGEPLLFKVPLAGMQGRLYFSLRGNIIKKDCRDAEVIFADNIERIVFSETPKLECRGWLYVSVDSKSTTGEEYTNSFELNSVDQFTIQVPQSELYWTPASGTASTINVVLGGGATTWSPNTSFESVINKISIGHSSGEESTLKLTIPNTPGSLNSKKLQLYVQSSFFGTWENVTIKPYNLTDIFDITESE